MVRSALPWPTRYHVGDLAPPATQNETSHVLEDVR